MGGERSSEKAARRGDVAVRGHVHVGHLGVLIHSAIHAPPDTYDLPVGLVDEPPAAYRVAARPGRVDQQWCEALHPPVQGDVIDVDAALSEELFEVAVRQPEPTLGTFAFLDSVSRC